MITDRQNMFSNAQALTADAASTNIIDTGTSLQNADPGPGTPLNIFMRIGTAINTLTSLNIILQCDSDEAFGSPKVLWTVNKLLAVLTANTYHALPPVPVGAERYLRLSYDVVGTDPTTGTIDAGIILEHQANNPTYAADGV